LLNLCDRLLDPSNGPAEGCANQGEELYADGHVIHTH
jgi:hypothetical protein